VKVTLADMAESSASSTTHHFTQRGSAVTNVSMSSPLGL
jgi:hypothetical protein